MPQPPQTSEELLRHILARLDDDQAEDVVVIDLTGKSSMCDSMVIASGRSQRHVASMAEHLRDMLKPVGRSAPAIEGLPGADWVLIDAGDVIVHLFRPEVRSFYNLEKMWGIELPTQPHQTPDVDGGESR
jgi:ribosome-associated protein